LKDPILFAYHIGDLDDFYFPRCRWIVAEDDDGAIRETILVYDNPPFETVLAFGLTDQFEFLLGEALDRLPNRFFCHYKAEYEKIFQKRYRMKSLGTHLKMKLTSLNVLFDSSDFRNVIRLDLSYKGKLKSLYKNAYPDSYFDERMLQTGKYFGYIDDGELIAVSGIHVYSDVYNIAVLGNIATNFAFRGKGLSTLVTSKLVEELTAEGKLIGLNVKADNASAIACYRKIGFEVVCEYEEAVFELA
jgi:ribosomal protein S18 acetylase RimI-like enzyme